MKENLPRYIRALLYLALALLVLGNAYSKLEAYGASHDRTALIWIAVLVCCAITLMGLALRAIKVKRNGGH
ncbi:hypothetical protein H6CHR_00337 [Variovorax sp. PBL-H6]|uniref:hypothetical protein n=1 Tax=Variovorax sp. PBL-H6 TaxID=434009 RepID=UPI0013161C3A|nr:hypothetical protein [Variovorax sp. PBL-H6]VTU15759.1 hypothetical protein H6CHR_00337 [Variovorax sp. PBL-H6]